MIGRAGENKASVNSIFLDPLTAFNGFTRPAKQPQAQYEPHAKQA